MSYDEKIAMLVELVDGIARRAAELQAEIARLSACRRSLYCPHCAESFDDGETFDGALGRVEVRAGLGCPACDEARLELVLYFPNEPAEGDSEQSLLPQALRPRPAAWGDCQVAVGRRDA